MAEAEEDAITRVQDELAKIGAGMVAANEETQQLHAPESAPLPPPGADPFQHYQEYWTKRHNERPFATRGFEHAEESAAPNDVRVGKRAAEMLDAVKAIRDMLATSGLDRSEETQLEELRKLEEDNEQAGKELEEAVRKANVLLSRVSGLQRQVATGALGF